MFFISVTHTIGDSSAKSIVSKLPVCGSMLLRASTSQSCSYACVQKWLACYASNVNDLDRANCPVLLTLLVEPEWLEDLSISTEADGNENGASLPFLCVLIAILVTKLEMLTPMDV
jgi:hypothetical protein